MCKLQLAGKLLKVGCANYQNKSSYHEEAEALSLNAPCLLDCSFHFEITLERSIEMERNGGGGLLHAVLQLLLLRLLVVVTESTTTAKIMVHKY